MPASKIAALSSGEFVGVVKDDPDNKIELKAFHGEIFNDHKALQKEIKVYHSIPEIRRLSDDVVQVNYLGIKNDIQNILNKI